MEVFGHRGACGYLPENTMESFKLAFELGSDAIEFDVVLSRDNHPVILHDLDLSLTTTNKIGQQVFELTLTELKALRVNERYPQRTKSHAHSGRYQIPTLAEVLAEPSFSGKHLIIEIKEAAAQLTQGFDVVAQTARVIAESDYKSRGLRLTIECFESDALLRAKALIPDVSFVFLLAPETLPTGETEISEELLAEIRENFDGLSVALPMLEQKDLVKRAKELGLLVYGYTARLETAQGDATSWFQKLIETGVDGLFADQPDLLLELVRTKP